MFRLWGKMWKDNHMLKDLVIDDDSEDTRTHKIFHALQEICYDFDLENPIVTSFQKGIFLVISLSLNQEKNFWRQQKNALLP